MVPSGRWIHFVYSVSALITVVIDFYSISFRWIHFVYSVSALITVVIDFYSISFLIVGTRLISVYCKR